ncbi:MAG: cytochrome P450 [Acidimicrobiales bacterium]
MATPVEELDLATLTTRFGGDPEADVAGLAGASRHGWLAKFAFGYVVLAYDDVANLLRERHLHQASQLVAQLFAGEGTALDDLDRNGLLSAEGERHARLRRLVAAPFAPRAIDRLRPFMREFAAEIAESVGDGSKEFVVDAPVALSRYPIAVICQHLNVERADWDLFSRWAETTFLIFSSEVRGNEDRIVRESREFSRFITALIDERRNDLGDDLISSLIVAEQEGDRLSTPEMVSLIQGIIAAGTDTTRNQLATSLALLSGRPDLWASLDDEELVAGVVEESLRYLNPIRFVIRQVHEPFEYRDVAFRPGTLLAFSLAGANRDEGRFHDAERFDPRRSGARDHLTFSSGIHHCLGAALARAELAEALIALRARWVCIEPAGEVRWKDSALAVWGAESVPLRVTTT